MTEKERRAAMDALNGILGRNNPQGPNGGQGGQGGNPAAIPPEYQEAWNKIMKDYDNENVTIADLEHLFQDIRDGKINSL